MKFIYKNVIKRSKVSINTLLEEDIDQESVKLTVCCCIMAILLETRTLSTENREVAVYIAGYTKRIMPAAMNMSLE